MEYIIIYMYNFTHTHIYSYVFINQTNYFFIPDIFLAQNF